MDSSSPGASRTKQVKQRLLSCCCCRLHPPLPVSPCLLSRKRRFWIYLNLVISIVRRLCGVPPRRACLALGSDQESQCGCLHHLPGASLITFSREHVFDRVFEHVLGHCPPLCVWLPRCGAPGRERNAQSGAQSQRFRTDLHGGSSGVLWVVQVRGLLFAPCFLASLLLATLLPCPFSNSLN